MGASEQKGPVMPLPRKLPQTYYKTIIICLNVAKKWLSTPPTMHMIHHGRENFTSLEGSSLSFIPLCAVGSGFASLQQPPEYY